MQPGLTAKQIQKLAKAKTDKYVLHGSSNVLVAADAWTNGQILLHEPPPQKLIAEWETRWYKSKPLSSDTIDKIEAECTVQVWPIELEVCDEGQARYVRFTNGDGLNFAVDGMLLSTLLKRAGKDTDDITYFATSDTGPLMAKNGHKLGAMMPFHFNREPEPDATFKYAGELPKPSRTKLDRFRNAHEGYWYIVQDGPITPEIMIIEDNWTEERCVYGGPVNGSKAAREWIAL